MYDVTCIDRFGNSVSYLTQWDVGQKYIVELDGFHFADYPEVHFANENSVESMKAYSSVSDGKIYADIPDELLQFSKPIYAYIYLTDSFDDSSKKTVAITKIPVRKKKKPENYKIKNIVSQSQYNFILNQFDKAISDIENMKTEIINLNLTLSSLPEIATVNELFQYMEIR